MYEQSSCKVKILRNENCWSYRLHKPDIIVRLQRIVPLNKVHCFWPYFHFVQKYQPSLASCEPCAVLCPGQCKFKVLSIPSVEITIYRVNSLLPTDFATLASQEGDPYQACNRDFTVHTLIWRPPVMCDCGISQSYLLNILGQLLY